MGSARTVDGPGDGAFVSTDQAAEWLGISDTLLEKMLEQHEWCKPKKVGRRVLWDWEEIFALRVILRAKGGQAIEQTPPAPRRANSTGGQES